MSETRQPVSKAARRAGMFLMWLLALALVEVASLAIVRMVPQIASRSYVPPTVTAEIYADYRRERDPLLGWPGQGWLAQFADASGARRSPENHRLADRPVCASVFGDSFAFAEEVDDDAAWANLLARDLGCRVANFGVGGYGTGQALLRLEGALADGTDTGGSVILTIYPDDLNRTVNGWRYLLGGNPLGFKPVFAPGPNGFELVRPFDGSFRDFTDLAADPSRYLANDPYLPGAPGFLRQTVVGFPYTVSLARILWREWSSIRSFSASPSNFWNYPTYFDTASGPSEAKVAANRFVLGRFSALCREQALNCNLLILPDPEMVYQRETFGAHTLGWLADSVPATIPVFDATDIFASVEDICAALTHAQDCRGHYNAAGNRRLAEFVLDNAGGAILAPPAPGR